MNKNIISNKYQKVYNNLVDSRKKLIRSRKDGMYYESHHIIPKSLGGGDEKENLVLLTAREHFLAHWLLTKCTEGQNHYRMICAFLKMYNISKDVIQRSDTKYAKRGRVYQKLREAYSESMKGQNNPNHGKKFSEERCKQMSEARLGEKNGMFGKNNHSIWIEKYGIEEANKKREEVKRKKSESLSGKNNPMYGKIGINHGKKLSKETKEKMKQAAIGRKLSEETKKKLSDIKKEFYKRKKG
jgi:hypothetical protein